MIDYKWNFLELFADNNKLVAVRYLLTGTNGQTTVSSEGKHNFLDETVNLPFDQIKETNLIDWLEKDTTKDDVNAI